MSVPDGPVAEFDGVVKDYRVGVVHRRTVRALAGVTFRMESGCVFSLLGPNRAGKTTLLKILLSLCRPTSGRVLRLGQPTGCRQTLARIGYVHENQAFPRYLTAEGLLTYYGAMSLLPADEVRERVPALLQRVGLADRRRETIDHFSKGMIQRLGLAQALLNEPDLLVLDEPSEGLDLEGRHIVRDVIAEQRQRGRTVLQVSHLLTEVERVSDQVAVIVAGRLVYDGSLSAFIHPPNADEPQTLEQALESLYEREAA
jgi:ABC-2 type transport system ATP-binding protein